MILLSFHVSAAIEAEDALVTEKTHCVKAALCREELLVDEIPVEEHDLRMDLVISEKGCYKM